MTNEEMVTKLEEEGLSTLSDMEYIIESLKENTKLKAEIEASEMARNKQNDVLLQEIKRLEAELEQSVNEIEQLKSRTCQSCVNKGKCAIFDNFNIDYCSDWEKGGAE